MKTKLKSLSKRSISVLLVLMMVVSTVTVGIFTTTAAFIDSDSAEESVVGASVDDDTAVGDNGHGGTGIYGLWYGTSDNDGMNSNWQQLEQEGTSTKYSHVFSFNSSDYFMSLTNGYTENWHWSYVWSSDPTYDNQYTSVVQNVNIQTQSSAGLDVHRMQITVRPPSGSSTVNVKLTWDTSNSTFYIESDKDPVCTGLSLTATNSTLASENETFKLTASTTTHQTGTIRYTFYREGVADELGHVDSTTSTAELTGLTQSDAQTAKYYVVAHNDNYMDVTSSKITVTNSAVVEPLFKIHGNLGKVSGTSESITWGGNKPLINQHESGNVFYIDLDLSISNGSDDNNRFRLYKEGGTNDYGPNDGNDNGSNTDITVNGSKKKKKNGIINDYFQVNISTAGKYRLYVDQSNEEAPVIWISTQKKVASSVALTINPSKTKLGNSIRTMTATVTGVDASLTAMHNITYTFKQGSNVIKTVTKKANETTCVISDIPSGTDTLFETMGTYPITVEVSTTETYTDGSDTKSYAPVSNTANVVFNNGNVYYTSGSGGAVDPAEWTELNNDALNTITANVSSLNPNDSDTSNDSFTFALSSEDNYVEGFPQFNLSQEDNKYCTVTRSTMRVSRPTDEDPEAGFTVYTYTVTALKGIKADSAELYIDLTLKDGKPVNKIYAKAEFDKTTGATNTGYAGDSGKKVRYYFAKKADQDNSGAIDNRNNKMYVTFWNNSVEFDNSWGDSSITTKLGGYVKAYPVKKDGTTQESVSADTKIYVDTNSLKYDTNPYSDNTGDRVGNSNYSDSDNSKNITFNVYAADLPIWATSACLRGSGNPDYDVASTKLITLNPNRIYLFYNWSNAIRRSGIPLDEKFWDAFTADSRKYDTYKNEAAEKTFKVNAIKYNREGSGSNQTWYKINSKLNDKYESVTTASDNPGLYFGMFAGNKSLNMTNWHYMANIAMRWNDNQTSGHNTADDYKLTGGCPYYCSVWDLVGMHLKPVTTTSNGVTTTNYRLQNFNEDQIQPIFDYSWLKESGNNAANAVYEDLDFPFVASKYDGVTTYSYDSQVDPNRKIANGNYTNAHEWEKIGSMLGYSPFSGTNYTDKNYSFGNEFKIEFNLTSTGSLKTTSGTHQDIQFNFSGDDDVWVFVDGVLVLDLGGDHMPSSGSINFTDKKVYYKTAADSIKNHSTDTGYCGASDKNDNTTGVNNVKTLDLEMILNAGSLTGEKFNFKDGATKHTLQMFYLERGDNESNCSLSFNLPQASGLNVYSEVTANHVNEGLKAAAMLSANTDAFRYNVSVKKADGTEWNNVQSTYSLISSRQTPGSVNDLDNLPKEPSLFNAWREFTQSFIYSGTAKSTTMKGKLSQNSGTAADSGTLSSIPTSYTTLANNTYELNDNYVKTESHDPIAGRTQASVAAGYSAGDFDLLTGQKATFNNKVPANMMVQLYQNKDLDEVNFNDEDELITTQTRAFNEVYDYYTTSYNIYDNQLQYYVKDTTDGTSTANIYANDNSSNANSFYFTNYSTDSNVTDPAMTVNYYNDINVGNIKVQKVVGSDETATSEAEFYFKVYFKNIFGFNEVGDDYSYYRDYQEYPIVYHRYSTATNNPIGGTVDVPDPAYPYDPVKGIKLRAGEYAIIEGVPVETEYKVAELNTPAGFSLSMIKKWAKYPGYENNSGSGDVLYKSRNAFDSRFNNKEIYYQRITVDTKELIVPPEDAITLTDEQVAENSTIDYTHDIPTNVVNGVTQTDPYPVNSIPIRSQTNTTTQSGEEYISTSWVQFTNQREGVQISFNYYPRVVVDGQPASISGSPDTYTYTIEDLYEKDGSGNYKYITMQDNEVTDVLYNKMIEAAMLKFTTYNGGIFRNVIDEYQMFTTQAEAEEAFGVSGETITDPTLTNPALSTASNKVEYTASNIIYHTNHFSQPITTSNKSDLWVSYFNNTKNLTNDNYVDVEAADATAEQKASVKKVNVWLYNYPKTYTVHYNTATETETGASFNNNDTYNGYYVGNNDSGKTFSFYYNQRFGGKTEEDDGDDETLYFLGPNEYNFPSYTGQQVETASEVNMSGTMLKFLYWAFDPYGYNKVSDDIRLYYRVSTNFKLYPVYGTEDQYNAFKGNPGLSVSLNGDDSFFDTSGNARRRVNVLMSPYNCPDNDPNIYSTALIYVTLSNEIKEACTVSGNLDEKKVNEYYQNYKSQLESLVLENNTVGTSINFSTTGSPAVQVTLTTRGFKHDVNSDYGTYSSIELTNKNRAQFSTRFTVNPKGTSSGLTDCFAIAVVMLYHNSTDNTNRWIASDNTVTYDFSKTLTRA